ncbi:hypothetical protein [Pseudoalteromonas obscura]|uniref:Uncharacterized protein n=1 Tax=Pseudoalteromonas obscura TaxID=3048491 RepID=A0ABT7EJT7_9GAMM|nr:hypothetical protein [Pseudoalteromonas sp. P94(2023)]MDK2595305.1 hypothetical protein [Pseudoalteromonas sp. P94(2023)]
MANQDAERIHSGAISLLSIMVGIFTFSLAKVTEFNGLEDDQRTYLYVNYFLGCLVILCGLASGWSKFYLLNKFNLLAALYFFLLVCITAFPPLVWIFR